MLLCLTPSPVSALNVSWHLQTATSHEGIQLLSRHRRRRLNTVTSGIAFLWPAPDLAPTTESFVIRDRGSFTLAASVMERRGRKAVVQQHAAAAALAAVAPAAPSAKNVSQVPQTLKRYSGQPLPLPRLIHQQQARSTTGRAELELQGPAAQQRGEAPKLAPVPHPFFRRIHCLNEPSAEPASPVLRNTCHALHSSPSRSDTNSSCCLPRPPHRPQHDQMCHQGQPRALNRKFSEERGVG